MMKFVTGNIFEADAEALVNTVNCVGIMGRGIALQFKNSFPNNFKAYRVACDKKEVTPGKMFVFKTNQLTNPKFIINFPTKRHWKGNSRIEDIENGLDDLKKKIFELEIKSIAIPPLGSGLGGLDWSKVKELISAKLNDINDVNILIYEPSLTPKIIARPHELPEITPGRAVLVSLMDKYLAGLLDPFVTLLEVHKLMYFMQEAGESLKLKYTKGTYGPYASNLHHVLNAIEGYYISGFGDGGENPEKELSLVPGAVEEANRVIRENNEIQKHFLKVVDLVSGFETPFGMELLATIHWLAEKEHHRSMDTLVSHTYGWNDGKRKFTRRQIEIAYGVLTQKGWISSKPY